ncbi:MAG: serine/threonine kinase [Halomonadaceae bacterium T82-2]|nr:MAG: serine/threonine kinase [Halomonadaceae bacterium T82-2]
MGESITFPEAGLGQASARMLRDDGLTRLLRLESDGTAPRLVKLRSGEPSPRKTVCLYNDHQTLQAHPLECALSLQRFEGQGANAMLLFNDPGGTTLDRLPVPTPERWVELALEMVDALDEVHRAGLLHRDLRLDSFLLSGSRLYLIDFSQAVRLKQEYHELQALDDDLARLRYMAPELSGRHRYPADYRSDYYSLGVALYQLLTGSCPFRADTPHALVYQHLAEPPPAPQRHDRPLPELLTTLLQRLLAKDPGRRYQDADTLSHHLQRIGAVLRGELDDDPAHLVDPHDTARQTTHGRVHGREVERRRLLDALARVDGGRPQWLWVTGASGLGKTALIRETYPPVTRRNAFFLSGKFDQLRRGRPYSAWTEMLEKLVTFLLAEPGDALQAWQARLHEALGSQARALSDLIPSLERLLGELPEPAELPAGEARERLHGLLLRFLQAIGRAERTLVLFLDDLQWSDAASLALLETLARRLDGTPLLLIGAYRDNEVDATHPLVLTQQAIERHLGRAVDTIALSPLGPEQVTALLAETLATPPEPIATLAEEVHERTGGNPLFIEQLLRTLLDNDWLTRDVQQGWQWNMATLREAPYAEHVVGLMLQRFTQLPDACRELLAWAACLGGEFELEMLGWLADAPLPCIHERLQPALDEGFLLPAGEPVLHEGRVVAGRLRFFHDRMQEAAQRLLANATITALHYRIAHLLRRHLDEDASKKQAMMLAGHLRLAAPHLKQSAERLWAARGGLTAAEQARRAAAFADALAYLRDAMALLPDAPWRDVPDLAYRMYRERGELEALNSHFETAELFIGEAIAHEPEAFRRAALLRMRVEQSTLRADYPRAIAAARQGLALLGAALPERAYAEARDTELAAIRRLLAGRSLDTLAQLPPMTDPRQRAIMQLLASLGPPCYRSHPDLWSVIVAREVRLCLEHGSVAAAAYSYPAFGGLLMHLGRGDGEDCAALYRATHLLLRDLHGADASVGHLMMGSSLRHWFSPLALASEDYLAAYRSGQASGNLQYAVYGFGHNVYCRFFQGVPLETLIPETLEYLEYSRDRRNRWGNDLITGALRVFTGLHGDWPHDDWPHKHDSEADYLARCEAHGNLQVLCIYHIMQAQARLLQEDLEAAARHLREAEQRLASVSVQGLLPVTQFHALKALVAAESPERLGLSPTAADACLTEATARYTRWCRHAPDNFEHWRQLLLAERERRRGAEPTAVIDAYDAAVEAAAKQGHWPAHALLAARAETFWRRRGPAGFAEVYHQQRCQALRRGNAHAVLAPCRAGTPGPMAATTSMDPLMQIAQSLAQPTTLDTLAEQITAHVAHQAGAGRVALLLIRQGPLVLVADRRPDGHERPDPPIPLDEHPGLPRAILRYVGRTERLLRFSRDEIGQSLLLGDDTYLQSLARDATEGTGTHWCVPLSYLGETLGVLYLEQPRRLGDEEAEALSPLLTFLAAQAAIAIRNIDLIDQLAGEARARREAELRIELADRELALRREMEQELQKQANTDALTGLANRRLFVKRLSRAHARAGETAGESVMLMIDIDHFKSVNDRFGHSAGDRVLCHLAEQFRDTLRPDDLAARLGGEEFGILLHGVTAAQASQVAERLGRRIADTPLAIDTDTITLTISIGLAGLRDDEPTHEAVLNRADRALYLAKARGRNRVCWDTETTG